MNRDRRNPGRSLALSLALTAVTALTAPLPAAAEPQAELITIGPGDALWNAFGHTAIRVVDRQRGIDRVYNYGVANFSDPSFIWGFLRGKSRYMLAVFSWADTLWEARAQNRYVYRQRLNLTRGQIDELLRFLAWNAAPENREYYYDHLMDNCSTRIRDVLDRIVDGALRRAANQWELSWTYRHHVLDAGRSHIAYSLGLDLASGPNQAVVVDGWAAMFLPVWLKRGAEEAVVDDARDLRLAQPVEVVIERQGPSRQEGKGLYTARYLVVGMVLLLGLSVLRLGRSQRRRPSGWRGRILGLLAAGIGLFYGLLGTAYLVLGIISVVPDTHWNENTWVFWPFDFWLLGVGLRALINGRPALRRWIRAYLTVRLVSLVGYAAIKLTGLALPQDNWVYLGCVAFVLACFRFGLPRFKPARRAAAVHDAESAVEDDASPPEREPMQAIIIGAGRGQRLMPYTEEQPKCFAEIGERRILDWVLSALRGAGLDSVVFIGGYRIDDVRDAYPELELVENDDWPNNNILASLLYAEDHMEAGFVSSYSDIVYTSRAVEAILEHPGDVVLAVDTAWRDRYSARSEHPESDAEKVVAEGDRVVRVARDVAPDEATGEFIGVAKFSQRGARWLRDAYHALRAALGDEPFRTAKSFPKAYLIDMLQELVEREHPVHLARIDGGYYEIDTTQDYELANAAWPAWVSQQGEDA